MASEITSLTIVYSTVYSDADQRKHQSSASLAFVRGIHRGPVNSPHKWPVMPKMFPFDDVIMNYIHFSYNHIYIRHSSHNFRMQTVIGLLLALCDGNHWSSVDSPHSSVDFPHKGPGFFMFSLMITETNCSTNNRDAHDLRRRCTHCDVTVRLPTAFVVQQVNGQHIAIVLHLFQMQLFLDNHSVIFIITILY